MAEVAPSRAAADVPATIHVRSDAFEDHGFIPERYTCDGMDTAPALAWRGVPGDTVELVMVCEDPDAPEQTFVHWMVAGIDSASMGLEEDRLPEAAIVGRNDFDRVGYGGPCPPPGHEPHRYVYTVIASAAGLNLEPGFSARDLHDALAGQVIARGELTGRYRRHESASA